VTLFIRLLGAPMDQKAEALLRTISSSRELSERERSCGNVVFEVDPATFFAIPRTPFAYWVRGALRQAFSRYDPLEQSHRHALVGVATGDDSRYLRCWWEINLGPQSRWRLFAKGGAFSRYYADVHLCIDWLEEGTPIELSFVGARVRKPDFLRPGLTWPRRSLLGLGVRAMPAG